MTIKELKEMNEKDRILWFASAKAKDLGAILKNEGVKGISKMKKAEKLAMIVDLVVEEVEVVTDEDIETIYNETKAINKEVNARQSFEEEFEQTLYARWDLHEITLEELRKVVSTYKLDIPVMSNRENTIDIANRYGDLACYEYMGGDYYIDTTDFDYEDLFVEEGYRWNNWEEHMLYTYNNLSSENYTIGYQYDSYGDDYFVIYRDKQAIAKYKDIEKSDLDKLFTVDVQAKEDKELLYKLLEDFMKQHEEYNKIINEHLEKERKAREQREAREKKYKEAYDSWLRFYQPYTMGKYKFEDIWNNEGEIKNYKLWREMVDFTQQERSKKEQYYKQQYSNLFGNTTVTIKEEDKDVYKRIYRIASLKLHPDVAKDNGRAMTILNNLKEQWGI